MIDDLLKFKTIGCLQKRNRVILSELSICSEQWDSSS